MGARLPDLSFGAYDQGARVGLNHGTINNEFYLPPGELESNRRRHQAGGSEPTKADIPQLVYHWLRNERNSI